jgi:hypothetical protein
MTIWMEWTDSLHDKYMKAIAYRDENRLNIPDFPFDEFLAYRKDYTRKGMQFLSKAYDSMCE